MEEQFPYQRKLITSNIDHLTKILIDHLQKDPYAPIREFVSNAFDATRGTSNPLIRVWGERRKLFIQDNGCGMTEEIIDTAFTRIAGHKNQFEQDLTIGMFGIGVLSAFILAERLEVHTRSLSERHGWKINWNRYETNYHLEPIMLDREGTLAILHLDELSQDISNNSGLSAKIKKMFALLSTPIFVGKEEKRNPANSQYNLINHLNHNGGEPKLLTAETVNPLFSIFYPKGKILAAYHVRLSDGTTIFLGFPAKREISIYQNHDVSFFSKGIYVHGSLPAFFPENLSFVVGLIDSPHFKLQITREDFFLQDKYFAFIKNEAREHIVNFLYLLKSQPVLMAAIVEVHTEKLAGFVNETPSLIWLFKEYYLFITSNGTKNWREIRTFSSTYSGKNVIYYLTKPIEIISDYSTTASSKGFITVYAIGIMMSILEKIALEDGVELKNAEEEQLAFGQVDIVPEPFRRLAARLSSSLGRRNLRNIKFVNLPGDNQYPTMFHTKTANEKNLIRQPDEESLHVDSLLLNIAHPLIRRLAGKEDLTAKEINLAADTLFQIAVIHSPFTGMWLSCREDMILNLANGLEHQLRVRPRREDLTGADCFVAMPYSETFVCVWNCFFEILSASPYSWKVIRADQHIHDNMLINSLQVHIRSSQRFLADISGLNPNVLLEVGMMLECDPDILLLICDKETFSKLPVDLSGKLFLVYDSNLRLDHYKFKQFLLNKLPYYSKWLAMAGKSDIKY